MTNSTLQSIINFFSKIYNWFKNLFKRETKEKTSKKADLKSILIKRAETMDPLDFDRADKGTQSESATVYDLPVHKFYGSDTPRLSKEFDQETVEETQETVLEIVEEPIKTVEDSIVETVEDAVESTEEVSHQLVEESHEEFVDESDDEVDNVEHDSEVVEVEIEEVDNVDHDSEVVEVEVEVMDVDNEPMRSETTETEELTIPIVVEAPAQEKKPTSPKLKWEPKASVPKYSITINSKLTGDDLLNTKITTKGKAAALAQAQMDKNKSRAKDGKDQLRREVEEKKAANALARAKIVEAERARVAAAKLKREEQSEKLKREASERFQKEKELKLKERAEYEEKKQEINRARVEAIKSSKIAI